VLGVGPSAHLLSTRLSNCLLLDEREQVGRDTVENDRPHPGINRQFAGGIREYFISVRKSHKHLCFFRSGKRERRNGGEEKRRGEKEKRIEGEGEERRRGEKERREGEEESRGGRGY
jgi:hypothetical protein